MDLLNENSLASLLRNCYENQSFRACILFNNLEDADTLLHELHDIHNERGIDGVRGFRRDTPSEIVFENGSTLTFLTVSHERELRGMRFHGALLHEDVMDTDAMITLQSHIREYVDGATVRTVEEVLQDIRREFWGTPENPGVEIPNVEIKVDKKSKAVVDDFLNSFKIHNSLEFGS